MPVEIFSRDQFEKALGFLPLGFKLAGAESGQLEYKSPIAQRIICPECKLKFYPAPGWNTSHCPKCGRIDKLPDRIKQPGELFLHIYSSIDPRTMTSRDTGKDSIRIVLVSGKDQPIGKLGHYVTRVHGWEERIKNKCREVWSLALKLPRCKKGHIGRVCVCKSGQNKGRAFTKCWGCGEWLGWLDE